MAIVIACFRPLQRKALGSAKDSNVSVLSLPFATSRLTRIKRSAFPESLSMVGLPGEEFDLTTSTKFTQALQDAISSNIVTSVKPSCRFNVPQSTTATDVDLQYTLVQYVSGASRLQ